MTETKNLQHLDCDQSIFATHVEYNNSRLGGASSGIVYAPFVAVIDLTHKGVVDSYNFIPKYSLLKMCANSQFCWWCKLSWFVCFSAVLVNKTRAHAMAGCRFILIILCGFAISLHISVCESCDSIYVTKWGGIGPLYRQAEGPANTSKSLSACSQGPVSI